MASSNTALMHFPYPPEQLHHASYDTLVELCNPGTVAANGPTVTARTKMSWKTFGEEMLLQVGVDERGTCVSVTSTSMLPTQVIDFGTHRKNVAKILDGLQRRLGAGQLAQ